ncbi:hypothetical protein BC829DRAFT_407645 [Chytridium lagenaria]|nr:hypothetical protein BC829DRAFT_407645 [Chytridium lagenaria]
MSSTTAAAAAAPRPKRKSLCVNLRWGTFGVAFLAVETVYLSVVLGCSLGTLIFRLCGMYGAWKNKLLNLLIRRFQFFILVGSLALVFALTIYFNICPEDLEEIQIINNPEIKFITKEVFVQPKA